MLRYSKYNHLVKIPDEDAYALMNFRTAAFARLTPLQKSMFEAALELDENSGAVQAFLRGGFLVSYDEMRHMRTRAYLAAGSGRVLGLTICPTLACNFACPYCFEEQRSGRMSEETRDAVVNFARRYLEHFPSTDISVTWFGGEPLLAPDVVESLSKRLMALADGRGGTYTASIITNGYLLTQDTVDLLARCKVASAQVTVDGLGATHDATRRLAGGGPTFDRIVANLRDCAIPFKVAVRHNVHGANMREMDELRTFVERIAEESGNDLVYYPYPVVDSEAARRREGQVGLICASDASEVGIRRMARDFRSGRGVFCGAQSIWNIGIDDRGNLQKCWEAVGRPELSFGTARDWDPASPLATASAPDNLTRYLNSALPVLDEECRECVWLPHCAGGCPHRRLSGGRQCVAYKDDAEAYVLALHARIGEANER